MSTAAAPSVQGVVPVSGPEGTLVLITGSGFTGATSVSFGSLQTSNVTVQSDTRIVAASPIGGTGTVDVTVTGPAGTSAPNASDQFIYVLPAILQTPTSGTSLYPGAPAASPQPQNYYVDPGLSSQLVGSIVSLLQTASSPDAAEARNMILRRLALQGDVVGSRIPPPRNISEIGGYINLLAQLKQPEMRSQMLAGILGVAGPSQPLGWSSDEPPLAFVTLPNDRPFGPGQPSIPLTFTARADFSGAIQAVVNALHQRGCALPFATWFAGNLPPAIPTELPPDDVLPYLGRTLDLAASAGLLDPMNDALVLARTPGTQNAFQISAQVLAPAAIAVTPGNYEALQCDATSCSIVSIGSARLVAVAPLLASAGFYPIAPIQVPAAGPPTGWSRFINITGLVTGVTKLGDELSLLYKWSAITHSVFASALHRVWNGTGFA